MSESLAPAFFLDGLPAQAEIAVWEGLVRQLLALGVASAESPLADLALEALRPVVARVGVRLLGSAALHDLLLDLLVDAASGDDGFEVDLFAALDVAVDLGAVELSPGLEARLGACGFGPSAAPPAAVAPSSFPVPGAACELPVFAGCGAPAGSPCSPGCPVAAGGDPF